MGRVILKDDVNMVNVTAFRGLNISEINDTQLELGESGDMTNFYITREMKLKKIEGYKKLFEPISDNKIQGMWYGKIGKKYYFLFATNGHIYSRNINEDNTEVEIVNTDLGELADDTTTFLGFNSIVYIINGHEFYKWDGQTEQIEVVEGYVPCVYCAALPNGERTELEGINALTGKKHMTFNADGTATVFRLAEKNLLSIDKVIVNGNEVTSGFTKDITNGTVTFTTAPIEGLDNVDIYWEKENESREYVTNNKYAIYYGKSNDVRVFMWGNEDNPNRFIYSDLVDGKMSAEYFPVAAFNDVGTSNTKITDIAKQQNKFVVFKENEAYSGAIETITIADIEITAFPVTPLNDSVGNVAMGQTRLLDNAIISLDHSLHRWILTNVVDERNEENISQRIQADLNKYDLRKAITVDWQERYEFWLIIDDMVWIYNYFNSTFSRLHLADIPTSAIVIESKLYLGTTKGKIVVFDEKEMTFDGQTIKAIYKLNFYDFGKEYLRKTLHNLWISINPQAHSQVKISYITDKGASNKESDIKYNVLDFSEIDFSDFTFNTYYNPKPIKVKIKAKKFTYFQLILENNSPKEKVVVLSLALKSEFGGESK